MTAGKRGRSVDTVYFIATKDMRAVKIGFTKSIVRRRLMQLLASYPFTNELQVMAVFAGDRVFERILHARFAHLRLNGEWFRFTAEIERFIRRACKDPQFFLKERMAVVSLGSYTSRTHDARKTIRLEAERAGAIPVVRPIVGMP